MKRPKEPQPTSALVLQFLVAFLFALAISLVFLGAALGW